MIDWEARDDFATHGALIVSIFGVHSNPDNISRLITNSGGSRTFGNRRVSGYNELQLGVGITSLLLRYKLDGTIHVACAKPKLCDRLCDFGTGMFGVVSKQIAKGDDFLFH